MPRKYQPGLESTKSWLKSHGKGGIEEVLEKSGLSTQKARMILKRYREEQQRLHASTDLGMSESSHSHKMTEALNRLKATLKWLGLID